MARLASVAKALFYPTPLRVIDLIGDLLPVSTPIEGGRLLDICCGEGVAAQQLARRWGLTSYGVELHAERAAAAQGRLTQALHGSYHQLHAPQGGFNVLFLNPPYDEGVTESGSGIRQEIQFLRDADKWLATNGLLVFIPPQHILENEKFRSFMRNRYTQVEAFRFPDPEFGDFKQVVVIARKARSDGYGHYSSLYFDLDKLPVLGDGTLYNEGNEFTLPVLSGPSFDFKLTGKNPFDLAPGETEGCYGSPQWSILTGMGDLSVFDRPLVEPRSGHVAMLLAAGCLNGTELPGLGIVKGSSEKIQVETIDEEEGVATKRDRIVSHLSVLSLETGDVTTWRTDENPEQTKAWFDEHGETLAAAVRRDHAPLFTDAMLDGFDFSAVQAPGILPGNTEPEILRVQKKAAAATAFRWKDRKSVILSGEMGTGKTTMAVVAAHLAGHRKVVCVLPTHLVKKWMREADTITRTKGAARTATKLSDVDAFFADPKARLLILSKERAKLGARWEAAVAFRHRTVTVLENDVEATIERYGRPYDFSGRVLKKEVRRRVRIVVCPKCGAEQFDEDGNPLSLPHFEKSKRACREKDCREQLWVARPISDKGTVRWPLARYINQRYSGRFALVIDEAHQYAAPDTDQSRAVQHLCTAATRILAMTGTLYGGRASSIFHLLYKVDHQFRQLYAYDECSAFVADHGLFEEKFDLKEYTSRYGHRRNNAGGRIKEIPGVNPAMINLLLSYTIFVKLKDLGYELPPFEEEVMLLDHDPQVTAAAREMAKNVKESLRDHPRVLGQYIMACLGYPDCPEHAERIVDVDPDDGTETLIAEAPAFPAQVWAKDLALINIVAAEKAKGRKVLAYFTQTHKRTPIPRVKENLEAAGFKVVVMDANISSDKREDWLRKQFPAGADPSTLPDVMLTNGRLVETGLDLLFATTIVQYSTEYSIPTLRQSTRRSWRLGQIHPVKVIYMAYKATMQALGMDLTARKMRAAELVDGDDLGGLSQFDEGGHDFLLELARAACSREEEQRRAA